MAKTESIMLTLGTKAPQFSLRDVVTNTKISVPDNSSPTATVIAFICNHCPYVKHINSEFTRLANDYIPKKVRFIAISSNDVTNYPDDSPENMILVAQQEAYPFPYLYDETQEVAKAYQAVCTPDFFIFDQAYELVYRGQFDNSRPGNNVPVTGDSMREALNLLIDNKVISTIQKPSLGCNIKWKQTAE